MNTLGFHNEELFEMITTIVTDYRDRKYDHVLDVLSDPETIHLFSTELMEHMVMEIPSFFLDPPSANIVTATPDTLVKDVIGSAQERLRDVAEHLKLTFFQKNQLPFTIIRILEMVYHPLGFFQKHEFPKFVTSIEKCSYVTITYQQPNGKNTSSAATSSANTTTSASATPNTHHSKSIKGSESAGKEHVDSDGVLNKTQSILGKKRKRDAVEETLSPETTQTSPKRSTTPSLMKIPWITAAQVQESGPFLKELESIMAVNFGYDEEHDEDDEEEEEEEEDSDDDEQDGGDHVDMGEKAGKDGQVRSYYVNGNNADRTRGEGTLEKILRKEIKSMGDSIYDEYEEVDEDWTPVEDGEDEDEDEEDDDDELEEEEEEEDDDGHSV